MALCPHLSFINSSPTIKDIDVLAIVKTLEDRFFKYLKQNS